jgi:hypothetical protein
MAYALNVLKDFTRIYTNSCDRIKTPDSKCPANINPAPGEQVTKRFDRICRLDSMTVHVSQKYMVVTLMRVDCFFIRLFKTSYKGQTCFLKKSSPVLNRKYFQ